MVSGNPTLVLQRSQLVEPQGYVSEEPASVSGEALFNRGKYGKQIRQTVWHFLRHFYGNVMEIISLKAPENDSASIWYIVFDLLMGETEVLISMIWDFWTCPDPQNQLFFSGDTRTPKQNQENRAHLKIHIDFVNLEMSEPRNVDKFQKDGRRQIPPIRFIKSWRSWI